MKTKKIYFPLVFGFVTGILFGIEATLIAQRLISIYSASACSKIPDGKYAVFVPSSNLVDEIHLERIVKSNRWASNSNCKLFKAKSDYIKESDFVKSSSFLGTAEKSHSPGYVEIPSKRYEIKKVWLGKLIGYFSEDEANLVRDKILESTYIDNPDFVKEPFIVNNINTNN